MALSRRRKSAKQLRSERLRQAREDAPTLHQFLPAALQVWVELDFDTDACLAQATRLFTVYPPAQAHFVYACPFGNCDGMYDLDEAVFTMLGARTSRATGTLHCNGRRARRNGPGPRCTLRMAFAVTVLYGTEPARVAWPAPAP